MTIYERILLGTAFGTIFSILLIPDARRPLTHAAPLPLSAYEVPLPPPQTLDEFSLWMEQGARRLSDPKGLRPREIETMRQLATVGTWHEPGNAYWHQCQALFAPNLTDAYSRWLSASRQLYRDDHRRRWLHHELRRSSSFVWPHYLANLTRDGTSSAMSDLSRKLMSPIDYGAPGSLAVRWSTFRNGNWIRENAITLEDALSGVEICDAAAISPRELPNMSPRDIQDGRTRFVSDLQGSSLRAEVENTGRHYRDIAAVGELLAEEIDDATQDRNRGLYTAYLLAVAPLAGLGIVIVALGGGALLEISRRKGERLRVAIIAVALIAMGLSLHMTLPGLAFLILASLVPLVGPTHTRAKGGEPVGRLYLAIITVLGLATWATAGYGLSLLTETGIRVQNVAPSVWSDPHVALRLTLLCLALLQATPLLWSFAQKIPPREVVSAVERRVVKIGFVTGVLVFYGAWVGLMIFGPRLREQGELALLNEPVYILSR